MQTILLIVHVIVALGIIGLVLIQQGKGADAGAAFGSGASATVFGSRGSANFLTRTTGILALIFFLTSLSLAALSSQRPAMPKSVVESVTNSAPAIPDEAPATDEVKSDLPPAATTSDKPADSDKPQQ
jgi:preprotein translocase subunit SecG